MLSGLSLVGALVLVAISVDVGVPGQELLSTLRFHIGATLLLLPLLLAIAGARLRALVMLGVVGLSLAQGAGIVLGQQQRREPLLVAGPVQASFHVLSFNVLGRNPRGTDAAAFVTESGADVVVLMEAAGVGTGLDRIAALYPYRLGCPEIANCDLAIFSRTPLVDGKMLQLPGLFRRRLFVASTVIDGQSVTIAALHLAKPYFDDVVEQELQYVRAVIGAIEGPVLLTGDFNAAAWSNAIAALADDLRLIPPAGYPATWPVEIAPFGVPIDNMFTRGPALIRELSPAPEAFGSNHLGLLARIDLF